MNDVTRTSKERATAKVMESCAECGMLCEVGEYHPYAACLMYKACHTSSTVRANLAAVQASGAQIEAELRRDAQRPSDEPPTAPASKERRCSKHGCVITETVTDGVFCGVCRSAELQAEIEHLQRRLDAREELVDGFEKQLGIQQADATITIGSEIERLQREHKIMAETAAANINEAQRLRVMVINLGGKP